MAERIPVNMMIFDLNGSRVTPAAGEWRSRPVRSGFRRAVEGNAGASRGGWKVLLGRPHFRDVYGVFVPTVARPAAPVGPAMPIGPPRLIATLALPVAAVIFVRNH